MHFPNTTAWSEPDDGLAVRLRGPARATVGQPIAVEIELRYQPPHDTQASAPLHLLLPRAIDRNHIAAIEATADGESLPYRGPPPPGHIGDVEDIELTPGAIVRRRIDIAGWFAWRPGRAHQVVATLAGWSYETRAPRYWTGSIRSPALTVQVTAPPATAAPLTSFWNVEIGGRYTLDVVRRGNDWAWTGHIPMPHHHATRIDWLDLDQYPALTGAADGTTHRFTFDIVDREIRQVPNRRQWRTTYRARIVAVD